MIFKPNIRLLTKEEIEFFKNEYSFEIYGKYLLVSTKSYKRTVTHDLNKDFFISSKKRKITITKETLKLYKESFSNTYLIELQNAINALIISYQDINEDSIKEQLTLMKGETNL